MPFPSKTLEMDFTEDWLKKYSIRDRVVWFLLFLTKPDSLLNKPDLSYCNRTIFTTDFWVKLIFLNPTTSPLPHTQKIIEFEKNNFQQKFIKPG